jgi:regulatory protein
MVQPFPGTITKLEAQTKVRRHLGLRINVFVDERFSFALDRELALNRGLRAGVELSASQLEELLREDGDARAYARALHFMSYRARSSREIRDRLKRDEWPDEVIERVVLRLQKQKLLSDAAFAATWVESRTLSRPRGSRALTQELRQKGVAREEIEAVLPDDEAELENAVRWIENRRRMWEALEGRERDAKIIGILARRGFGYGTARAAIRRLDESDE